MTRKQLSEKQRYVLWEVMKEDREQLEATPKSPQSWADYYTEKLGFVVSKYTIMSAAKIIGVKLHAERGVGRKMEVRLSCIENRLSHIEKELGLD